MRRILWFCLLLFLPTGCRQETTETGKPLLVCTTGMLAEAVGRVAGPVAEVVALMGPGVDPHLYKARQSDLWKLSRAEMIFLNGLHLEGRMGKVFTKLQKKKPVIAIGERLPRERLLFSDSEGKIPDPHIWMDVSLWAQILPIIAEALARQFPHEKEGFYQRARAYQSELEQLHAEVQTRMAAVPPKKRLLVTSHDAFRYFGRAYQVEVKALQGTSTVADYGLKTVVDMVDLLIKRGICTVFVETSVSDRALRAVIEGCRAQGHEVSIGGWLYSDALGSRAAPEGNYAGMMGANVQVMATGMRCGE